MTYQVRHVQDEKNQGKSYNPTTQSNGFNDQRASTLAQLRLQGLMHQSDHSVHAANTAPIQAVWKWEKIKTSPGKWKWVDPKDVGDKRTKPPHDGTEHGELYPKVGGVDLAAEHKRQQIEPYVALLPHMKGELDGDSGVKGGHVWKMMQAQWGDRLSLVTGARNEDAPWNCTWTIDTRTAKASTMFPASWDEVRIRSELENSTYSGGRLSMGTILIKKAGDTFYPEI